MENIYRSQQFTHNQASQQDSASSSSADQARSKGSSNAKLTEERKNEILEMLTKGLGSSKAAEVGSSKSIRERERELASKMKMGPKEMTKWLGITDGDDLNEVFAHSTVRLHYKGSTDVQVTKNQKKEILEILRKGLGSCSGKDSEVGGSNSIQKIAIEVEVAGFEMQKLLGATDDFNEVIANSNAKVAGFEFQIQKSGEKNVENAKVLADDKLPEQMTNVQSEIQSSVEMKRVVNDINNSESIDQGLEEDLALQPSVPMDIEEVYLIKSEPLDSDDEEKSSLFVEVGGSRSFSPKNLQEFDEDIAWELETSAEYFNSKLVKDFSTLKDAETQTEESELSLTRLLSKPIKRKSRIDQYFPVLKKVKNA